MQLKHGLAALSNRLTDLTLRIARLRLPQYVIAQRTGLDDSTLSRAFNGKTDPLNSTLDKIEAAVAEEEAKLRAAIAEPAKTGAAA